MNDRHLYREPLKYEVCIDEDVNLCDEIHRFIGRKEKTDETTIYYQKLILTLTSFLMV